MTPITPKPTPSAVAYHDFYLRLIACIVAAHIIVAYGESLSVFQMVLMPTYYYALIPSFLIAMALFSIIRSINIKLDKKYDWVQKTLQRIGMQVFFGLSIPAFSAFLLAFAYFSLRGVNIFKTTYLQYDFHFILLQLLLINLYYLAYYFYQKWLHAEKTITALVLDQDEATATHKHAFIVSKGASNISLLLDEIAYFYRNDDNNYIKTVKGEDYYIGIALDEVQEQLPPDCFFRANRQLLVHRQACKGFDLLSYGKLNAIIEPPFSETVISQKRASAFRKWLEAI